MGPSPTRLAGHLDRPYLQRLCVDPPMKLAPLPGSRGPVLAGRPLPFAHGLDPGAVDQEVQGARARAARDGDRQIILAPAGRGSKSGTGQSSLASLRRLATSPPRHWARTTGAQWLDLAQRQAKECPSRIRQVWIAASENVAGRPRRPLGAATHSVSGIKPDPQRAALLQRRVVGGPVRRAVGRRSRLAHAQPLTRLAYKGNPRGFAQQSQLKAKGLDLGLH